MSCKWSNDSAAVGAGTVVPLAVSVDWWCSDGPYNVTNGASLGIVSAVANAWETGLTAKTLVSASNFDRRFDHFFQQVDKRKLFVHQALMML